MFTFRYWVVWMRGWFASISFERGTWFPKSTQRQFLLRLIKKNASTQFGRDHGFAAIRNIDEFRSNVPITTYLYHRPYIDQILDGNSTALTSEPPFMFASTSGTTSEPKWIPINKTWYQEMAQIVRIWLYKAGRSNPSTFNKKVLTIVSPAVEETSKSGLPVGSVSGLTVSRIPWIIRQSYAIPYEVAEIKDYDLRYYLIARISCEKDISLLITPNPATLSRIARVLEQDATTIIKAIRDGDIGMETSGLSEAQQEYIQTIAQGLKANPTRADALLRLHEQHGTLKPKHCWPDLCLIGCWLGGSAGVHAEALKEDYGPVQFRDLGFRATEGTFSITLSNNTPNSVLAIHANFYEFIPVADIDTPTAQVLLSHELEVGQQYYIIITTIGGLYRYDMNDIILVTGMYKKTPTIRFLRKGRDMVSIVGEKLHVNQALAAAQHASEQSGLKWVQFQIIPDIEVSQHLFLVEFSPPKPPQASVDAFIEHFDNRLLIENPEYPTKRNSGRLKAPKIILMQEGWAEGLKAHELNLGKREVQYKWRYISSNWDEYSQAHTQSSE